MFFLTFVWVGKFIISIRVMLDFIITFTIHISGSCEIDYESLLKLSRLYMAMEVNALDFIITFTIDILGSRINLQISKKATKKQHVE